MNNSENYKQIGQRKNQSINLRKPTSNKLKKRKKKSKRLKKIITK